MGLAVALVKRLRRGKFWAKFPFWRGAVRGEVFGEVFFAKFSGLFCWDSQSKKTSARTSAQNSHDSAQQSWRNFRAKLHDLSGHHSHWSEYVNVIGVISEPFAREFR